MVLVSVLISCGSIFAIPAQRGIKKLIRLQDGTKVTAELKGDEWMHWWQAADGRTFVFNDKASVYEEISLDTLQASSSRQREHAAKSRAETISKLRMAKSTRATEKKRGLILLVNFADKKFNEANTKTFYERMANEEGYSERGFHGSIRDYFLAQSNGAFDVSFDVVGPVEMQNGYAYYGSGRTSTNAAGNAYKMVIEACKAADKDVDFSKYDWNGDGEVDQVVIVYAGPGFATGGDDNTIWPHETGLSAFTNDQLTLDGMKIEKYACSNEIMYPTLANGEYDKTQEIPAGIGILCHEFSHCLGLPDMYDTAGQRYYCMSVWSVMDQGCYAGGTYIPVNYTAHERMFCGWAEPVTLDKATSVKGMGSSTDYQTPFIIYSDSKRAKGKEYYLLENRQPTGWDKGLEGYGRGLIITHVDYNESAWSSNEVNAGILGGGYLRCTVFQADNGKGTPFASDTLGIAGDPYPYIVDGVVKNNSLTNESAPASIINNKDFSFDEPDKMSKPITNITMAEDGSISFDFMGGSADNVITAINGIIDSTKPHDGTVRVYDATGSLVISVPSSSYSDSILPANGFYIVKEGNHTRKIVR